METRQQKMSRYISDSRAELQFGPLEVRLHDSAVRQWLERVRFIPDDYLDECYQMAMDNHGTRSPLMPKELYDQWQILRQRGVTGRPRVDEEKRCEFWCSQDGWIITDAGGVVQIGYPKKVEYLYAKPCPVHRPNGFKRNDQAAPWCAGDWPRVRAIESLHVPVVKSGAPVVEDWSNAGSVALTKDLVPDELFEEPIH